MKRSLPSMNVGRRYEEIITLDECREDIGVNVYSDECREDIGVNVYSDECVKNEI